MSMMKKVGMWIMVLALSLGGLTIGTHVSASAAKDVTRGEFVKAVVQALEYELGDGKSHSFTDVDAAMATFVEAAMKNGLVKGSTATTFKPNEKLTREQAFIIISRAIETDKTFSTDLLNKFKDKNQFKTNELEELAKSVGLNIFRGFEDGTAKPQLTVTDKQMKKMIIRMLEMRGEQPEVKPSDDTVSLRILGTTDLHMNFVNYDYYQDKPTNDFGLAKTAVLIDEARTENPNNLLFDNGDLIQGTPLGAYKVSVEPLKEGETHPAFAAFKALDYDAASLGNHEFNFGLDYLNRVIDGSEVPIINASVYDAVTKKNKYTPYVLLDKEVVDGKGNKHTIKVGVIGVVTPGIMKWDKQLLEGKVTAEDPVVTVNRLLPEVREKGADVVVVIAHSGIGDEIHTPGEENVTYQLSEIEGVDAILTGHDHATFPGKEYEKLENVDMVQGKINGTPVVMPGKFGSHLGIIDLELEKSGDAWKIIESKGFLREIDKKSDIVSQKVIDAVKAAHEGTIEYVRSPVGKTTSTITSYFSLVKDDPSIQIVTNAQKWYVEKQVKGSEFEKLPILSAGAPFKAGGRNGANYYTEIPAGEIAIKNVADLYVFDNTLSALVLTGADVKEWLEMSAGQFNQINPSSTEEQDLVNEEFRTYNFDVIDGVTYKIDVTKPAKYDYAGKTINESSSRITDLQYDGKPIDLAQKFIVVTNNYRASGNFPGVVNAIDTIEYADENREAIMQYMIEEKTIDPSVDNNWSFVPVEGKTNIIFQTSGKAKDFLPKDSGIQYIAPTQEGFAKFSIDLK